jgi:hypothetical protein
MFSLENIITQPRFQLENYKFSLDNLYPWVYSFHKKTLSFQNPQRSQPVNENKEYPKVRVTKQAHAHLIALVPAVRKQRGLNVSMTDIVSELILEMPMPIFRPEVTTVKPMRKARKARKANAPQAVASA